MKLLPSYQLIIMYFNISKGEKRKKTRISLFLARMITLFLVSGERYFFAVPCIFLSKLVDSIWHFQKSFLFEFTSEDLSLRDSSPISQTKVS